MKHNLVLVHSRTNLSLLTRNLTQVRQFGRKIQNIQNLKKFKRFNRFWSNSIPKVLDRCIIFVCIFRTIALIFVKFEPHLYHRHFSKYSKSHKISDWASICMKIVKSKIVTPLLLYQSLTRYLKPFINYSAGLKI